MTTSDDERPERQELAAQALSHVRTQLIERINELGIQRGWVDIPFITKSGLELLVYWDESLPGYDGVGFDLPNIQLMGVEETTPLLTHEQRLDLIGQAGGLYTFLGQPLDAAALKVETFGAAPDPQVLGAGPEPRLFDVRYVSKMSISLDQPFQLTYQRDVSFTTPRSFSDVVKGTPVVTPRVLLEGSVVPNYEWLLGWWLPEIMTAERANDNDSRLGAAQQTALDYWHERFALDLGQQVGIDPPAAPGTPLGMDFG